MCGIVGGVGHFAVRNFIINGLKTLEYRGYDSAGVALKQADQISLFHSVGRVSELEKKVPDLDHVSLGIGHTRWATHGEPSDRNCHPIASMDGKFVLVHNGVIENYRELKERLLDENYTFRGETDTEVIVNLLDEKTKITNGDILSALRLMIGDLKGSYALAILHCDHDDRIYFAKCHSPLLIGIGQNANYLASDALPMIELCQEFVDINNGQYGYIADHEILLMDNGQVVQPRYVERKAELFNCDLGCYPHYMLKEIEEAPSCLRRLLDNYYDGHRFLISPNIIKALHDADELIFIACGTSYYASLIGQAYMESIGKRAATYIASEWAYYPHLGKGKTLFVLVSQSGETADIIRCLQIINEHHLPSLTITNSKGSTLDREATYSMLLYAGVEIAVASTKAYTAQVATFALLKGALTNDDQVINDLGNVIETLENTIQDKALFKEVAEEIAPHKDVFFLGRGYDYLLSLEASLKLKEISYIHSEAFPGGELKHGPIALIEKGTPVLGYISDPHSANAIRGNFTEVETRGAKTYAIVSQSLAKPGDRLLVGDSPVYLSPIVKVMVAQYIAYYTALNLKLDIDKPRNLAKSVTVE